MTLKTVRLILAAIPAILAMNGCATVEDVKTISAGQIGCPPSEIQVSDSNVGAFSRSWTASCRGKTYSCSATDTLKNPGCAQMGQGGNR